MDKKLEPKDYVEILVRRKWFFIIPFVIIFMIAGAYAKWAPKIYQASSLITVEEQQQSPNPYYVQPTVIDNMQNQLQTVEQRIKSRTFLETIIKEFNLVDEAQKKPSLASMVQSLRNRIVIKVTGTLDQAQAFSIALEDRDPVLAMKIVNRLTALFIARSLQQREEVALGTISFLDRELERVQKQLKQQEREVSAFRTSHLGMLTEDLSSGGAISTSITDGDNLVALYSLLRQLRLKYTDDHPEIIALKARIAEIERSKSKMVGTTPSESQSDRTVAEATNQVEQQFRELTSAYEATQREYQSLLDKRLQAELAAAMERTQKGLRFQVLDEARVPEAPIKPKRSIILLIGLLLAMSGGAGLVAAMDYFDNSFYKAEDVEGFTQLPVIASISNISISVKKKSFYHIWEEVTERISAVRENIFNMIKKKQRRN
jgi:succinoglycan biosynthesis transport protein ExoP